MLWYRRLIIYLNRFVPADTLWAFCLGLNVFLTFNSHKFNVRLRKLERFYCAGCYGIPLIPALIYFVLDTRYGHEIYGNATVCQFFRVDCSWLIKLRFGVG